MKKLDTQSYPLSLPKFPPNKFILVHFTPPFNF